MTISLRLNEENTMLIKKYAEINHLSVSELIRQATIGRIETEYDLEIFEKVMEEYRSNPVTYSFDGIEKDLGLQ